MHAKLKKQLIRGCFHLKKNLKAKVTMRILFFIRNVMSYIVFSLLVTFCYNLVTYDLIIRR